MKGEGRWRRREGGNEAAVLRNQRQLLSVAPVTEGGGDEGVGKGSLEATMSCAWGLGFRA